MGMWVSRQYPVDLTTEWWGAYATLDASWDPREGESLVMDAETLEGVKSVRARRDKNVLTTRIAQLEEIYHNV